MRIRRILLAAPIVVILLFLAAFFISRPYFHVRQEALVMASIGEPEILNPVLSTTASASTIQDFVFDTLLKLDENARITTSLATSYELNQTSSLYFVSPAEASAAAGAIDAHRDQWQDIGLVAVMAQADSVQLSLKRAGTAYQTALLEWIAPVSPQPFQRWLVQLAPNLTWQGKPLTSDAVMELIENARGQDVSQPRILYAWKNTSNSLELYTIQADGPFMDRLQQRLAEKIGVQVKSVAPPSDASVGATSRPSLEGVMQIQFDKSWPARDEPLITLHLRENVLWHDGVPFDSADVLFTYQAFMNEKNASSRRSDFELIKDVLVPDPFTVQVRYKEPYSPCLYTWAGYSIIPRHLLADEPDLRHMRSGNRFNQFPVGTGPFKMESWVTGQQISLIRNDRYWQGSPHLERIVYRIIPDPTVSQLEFQTGGFDYQGLQPYEVSRFEKDPLYAVYRGPSNSYLYIGWNLKSPFFQDKRVRTALAHAVDVQAIIKYISYGTATAATGPYTPMTSWFDETVKPIPFDPARAKELLAEAGWTPGPDGILAKDGKRFHFTLILNNANTVRKDIAVLTQQYLRDLSIEVEVIEYEWAVFITQYIDARNFDACVLGWSAGLDQDLTQIFDSSQVDKPSSLNFVSYSNPEVDRLIAAARTEFDMKKVREYTSRIQRLIYEDQPYMFLYYPESIGAMLEGLYHVERPGDSDQPAAWIAEPIRRTKLGFTYYEKWWKRGTMQSPAAPSLVP